LSELGFGVALFALCDFACAEVLVDHALVDFVLSDCTESDYGWTYFDRRHMDLAALLRLLRVLSNVFSRGQYCMDVSAQMAALCLSMHNVEIVESNTSKKMSAFRKQKRIL